MELMESSKSSKIFYCIKCDYSTSRESQYIRHLNTRKHKMEPNGINGKFQKFHSDEEYICDVCNKKYKTQSGLWKHKNKNNCIKKVTVNENTENVIHDDVDKNMLMTMIDENKQIRDVMINANKNLREENKELKGLISEVCKQLPKIQNTTINNNNIFNINMFLNEDCKDAMNLTDFIDSIQLSVEDIESIGSRGQIDGMATILINKLNNLDVLERPMHCSDVITETIYIKDKDKWQIESADKQNIKDALDQITMKTIKNLPEITSEPDNYIKTVNEILKDPRDDKKIISKVASQITIDKNKV